MPAAIGAVLFAIGAPLAVVNFVTIGFGATLISLGLGTGLSLASAALFGPKLGGAPRLKPSDGQQTIRQAVPPRWRHYGRVRVAGAQFWFDTEAAQGELFFGLCINEGLIAAFEAYHIDDSTVEIDGSGDVTTSPYSDITTKILTRLGEPTETAYSEINTDFAYANIRGDGVATVLGIFDNFATAEDQRENFPNSLPKLRVTIRASVVWDGRDESQIRTDPSTWQWSENPVICLLDYFLSSDGFGLPYDRFENSIDDWFDAANICEEQVWSAEDSQLEDRYRIAATYLFTEDPTDVVRRFEETFGGRTWQQRDGSIGIVTGKFKAPVVTIGDDAILRFNLERGEDRLSAVAGVRAQYMSPGNDYREQDATAWPDGETVLALTDKRVVNLQLTWTPSHGQARRLMQAVYERAQAKWSGQIITNLAGLRAFDERYIRLQIGELGIDETFEVDHYTLDLARLEVTLEVKSASDIADPVRATAVQQTGFHYRGSGHVESIGEASPGMDYLTVDDGFAAQVGDVVVWSMKAEPNPTYSLPAGWNAIHDSFLQFGLNPEAILWKVITQADIDAPAQPWTVVDVDRALMLWTAFEPPASGTATLDLLDLEDMQAGNPPPVTADATGITAPHIQISTHLAHSASKLASANWSGDTPDYTQSEQMDGDQDVAIVIKHKVFEAGPGVSVQADMNDEGLANSQLGFILKFI